MKRLMVMGLTALAVVLAGQRPASAWSRLKFGVGLNISWEGGGNSVLFGLLTGNIPARVAATYDRILYKNAKLADLPAAPLFVFNASNLQTGALWRFTPLAPWKAGDYRIVIQTTLEDLAGNHIGRAFDVDTFDPITRTVARDTVSVAFRTRR